MITIKRAAQDYGITVEHAENAAFTIKYFELTAESTACILWFCILNKQNQGIPGVRLMTTNGGEILTDPSKPDGYTDVGMGGDSAYFPKEGQSGPHSAWVHGATSDIVHGLGWDGSTDHQSLITIWEGEGGVEMPYELIGFGDLNLHEHFRNAGVTIYDDQKYGVVELWARSGEDKPFPFEVTVRKKDGSPAVGKVLKLKRDGGESGAWDYETDAQGCAIIHMDDTFKYAVPGDTHYSIQVGMGDGGSDVVAFGWVAKQRRWFDVVFQARGAVELPGKPQIEVVDTASTSVMLDIECEGADMISYTIDTPDYHDDGEWTDPPMMLSGLQPATTYHLKVWGSNTAGDGPDKEFDFTTLEEQGDVPPPVENLRLISKYNISLGIGWDASPSAGGYFIMGPHGELETTALEYKAGGLEPGTAYHFSVSAGNEHGWSEPTMLIATTLISEMGCEEALIRIEAKLDHLAGVQAEGFDVLYAKMSVAIEELTKVVAELKRIEGCVCE